MVRFDPHSMTYLKEATTSEASLTHVVVRSSIHMLSYEACFFAGPLRKFSKQSLIHSLLSFVASPKICRGEGGGGSKYKKHLSKGTAKKTRRPDKVNNSSPIVYLSKTFVAPRWKQTQRVRHPSSCPIFFPISIVIAIGYHLCEGKHK